jgi:DNA-binding response OmpR family regulator
MSTIPTASVRPLSLLVVEDNRDVADSLAVVLRHSGYNVSVAYDGIQAITMIGQSSFEVVVCDIGLPGLSGYEVAARIRKLRGKDPLLVAMSAYCSENVRYNARNAGFDSFFSKPADPVELEQLIRTKAQSSKLNETTV